MARRLPLVAFVVVVTAGALVLWLPYVTARRDALSATPSPPAVSSPTHVRLDGGDTACLRSVTFDRDAEVVAFTLARPAGREQRLVVSATAPGYRARGVARP